MSTTSRSPKPASPTSPKINVTFTEKGGAQTVLPYAKSAGACDSKGGWYYDADPATGHPGKIILCASTCESIKTKGTGKVDLLLGCKTIVS